jgi:DNA-directed RNA polymerase subunit A'
MKVEDKVESKIVGIEYGLLSPAMIKNMAAVEITSPELYDIDGMPIDGGLADTHMGVIDPGLICKTCGNSIHECPGHPGYITLARPVYHIKYLQTIVNTLNATCEKCGRVLLDEKTIEKLTSLINSQEYKDPRARRKLVKWVYSKATNVKVCPHCGYNQEKAKLQKPFDIFIGGKKVTPIEVRERLEKIPDSDAILLGFDPEYSRPEWMVLELLPVPPVTVRPPITLENGMRSEDDLTHALASIIRVNEKLKENLRSGVPIPFINQIWDVLQYYVAVLMSNSVAQLPKAKQRSGTKTLRGIEERLKGKEGRFRGDLLGKRVNYAARSVISPDPFLDLDEVGVPIKFAKDITIPERVTSINIDKMKELIKNYNKYPGALYVVTPDGIRKKINENTVDQILKEVSEGYIVERTMMDGDIVLFNREPTLHKYSIMAHRARILPTRTLTINPTTTTPYNADFDGDEMNIFVPQDIEAFAEAQELMSVRKNLVSVRHALPLVGAKQDYISGCALLTSKDFKVSKEEASFLLANVGLYPELNKDYYSGREIFSMLLPEDFDFEGPSSVYTFTNNDDDYVRISGGKLITGIIDNATIGVEDGKLIQRFWVKYGPEKTAELINRIARLSVLVLLLYGFSVVISNYDIDEEIMKKKEELVKSTIEQVNKILQDEKDPDEREDKILMIAENLNKSLLKLISPANKDKNMVYHMAITKAKGSLSQIVPNIFLVGQQILFGKRLSTGYKNRLLPHFLPGSQGLLERGFVFSSYKKGLSPLELFMHSMASRETAMDNMISTPKSGYLYRRLSFALMDLHTDEQRTVRYGNRIVQFLYGEDGIDVSKSNNGGLAI